MNKDKLRILLNEIEHDIKINNEHFVALKRRKERILNELYGDRYSISNI